MSSTKIINVLKDDSFAEILALFKSTPAGEVIFVLPKRSKAFQKEEHFALLREAANEVDKIASFLSSDSKINELAQQHDFEILLARASAVKPTNTRLGVKIKSRSNPISVVNQIESFYEQPLTEEEEKPVSVPIQIRHEVEEEEEEQPQVSVAPIFKRPRKRRLLYTFGSAGVILVAVLVYLNTGSAQVVINPGITQLNFQLNASAGENIASVNASTLTLPGQTFTVKKSVSQTFNATGSKDVAQKARGSITLYNKTSSAQPLIATTRFESIDGHIFHSLTSVTVPAAKNSATPGTVEVQVIADKIGSDYNVSAGTFGIVAFKEKGDTAKYQNITGTSSAAMHGGTSGKAIVVTADDFTKAKDLLTVQLKQAISDEAKAQTAGLKVINDADITIDTPISTAVVDDAADTFTMTLNGTLKTAGFKETDLQQLIVGYVNNKYNLDILAEKLTVIYSNVKFDTTSNTLHMTVAVTGPSYTKVDEQKILTYFFC